MQPCTRCVARRGAQIPALVRLGHGELPICVRHRRTLVSSATNSRAKAARSGVSNRPSNSRSTRHEILAAARRYRALRRRRPATIDPALTTASQITSEWWSWQHHRSEPDPIVIRWRERSDLLPRADNQVIRYPETIALATLFARIPQLLLTPRGNTDDPAPIVFLIHAAKYGQDTLTALRHAITGNPGAACGRIAR